MVSNINKYLFSGLFHKAIIQSGVSINPWANVTKPSIKTTERLAKILNKNINEPKQFVEYLQTLDVAHLIDLENQLKTPIESVLYQNPFLPSVDKNAKKPFLSVPLEEAIKNGIKVPCIIGSVTHEGILMAGGLFFL